MTIFIILLFVLVVVGGFVLVMRSRQRALSENMEEEWEQTEEQKELRSRLPKDESTLSLEEQRQWVIECLLIGVPVAIYGTKNVFCSIRFTDSVLTRELVDSKLKGLEDKVGTVRFYRLDLLV